MKQSITFITGNKNKAHQLESFLKIPVHVRNLDLPEIQSLDLHEVITAKVKEAYNAVGSPVLVEDVALVFLALGRLPGPFIKWFLKELNPAGLCDLLDHYTDRRAVSLVYYAYFDGKNVAIFEGKRDGTIAEKPRGDKGFGFDPIFIPHGHDKTWGEMELEERIDTSSRHEAAKKLEIFMKSL